MVEGEGSTNGGQPTGRRILKTFSKAGSRIIYGPASVAIRDREGDLITGDALRGALGQFLLRSTISLNHLDIVVGKLLESVEIDGVLYKTEVRPLEERDMAMFPILAKIGAYPGIDAMFVVAQIHNDTAYANSTWDAVLKGELGCFSISGQAIQENRKVDCSGFSCKLTNEVSKMDGSAITLCPQGMNDGAVHTIIAKSNTGDVMTNSSSAWFNTGTNNGVPMYTLGPITTSTGTSPTYNVTIGSPVAKSDDCGCKGSVAKADDKKDEAKESKEEDKKDTKPKDDKKVEVVEPEEGEKHEGHMEGDKVVAEGEGTPIPKEPVPPGVPTITPLPKPNGPSHPEMKDGMSAPIMDSDPMAADKPAMEIVVEDPSSAERLIGVLEQLIGKNQDAYYNSIEFSLKATVNGFRPHEGEERGLKLGYPQYPQGPSVKITPSPQAATQNPPKPDSDMNDPNKNPEFPAGSDRMQDSAVGDKPAGKRPQGFFMRSENALYDVIDKLVDGPSPAARAANRGSPMPKPSAPPKPSTTPEPVKPTMPKPGTLEQTANIASPSTQSGKNLQNLVAGGMAGARREEHGHNMDAYRAAKRPEEKSMSAVDGPHEAQAQHVIGQGIVQKPHEMGYQHTQPYMKAVQTLVKAGYRDVEAHKVANSVAGYEYVRHCPSCFSLMKAHKNYQFYAMMLNKAIQTGAVPIRSMDFREEGVFQKDVRMVREALGKINFSTAPDGGLTSPMGVMRKADPLWRPYHGSRGGIGAQNIANPQDIRYGPEAQALLSGQTQGSDQEGPSAEQAEQVMPQAGMGAIAPPVSPQSVGPDPRVTSEPSQEGIPVRDPVSTMPSQAPGPGGAPPPQETPMDEDEAALAEYEANAGGPPLLGGPAEDEPLDESAMENIWGEYPGESQSEEADRLAAEDWNSMSPEDQEHEQQLRQFRSQKLDLIGKPEGPLHMDSPGGSYPVASGDPRGSVSGARVSPFTEEDMQPPTKATGVAPAHRFPSPESMTDEELNQHHSSLADEIDATPYQGYFDPDMQDQRNAAFNEQLRRRQNVY